MNRHILFFGLILLIASLIRILGLSHYPPSPYWEEVALGYDAYSLLQTGKDHHGHAYPLVALTSFGDYKPTGYVYALLPSIWLFGLSVTAVRLPSAIAGIFIVLGIGLLTRETVRLIQNENTKSTLHLALMIGMAVSSISPWLIQFSRGGWEVNLATCFVLWGVLCSLWAVRSKKSFWTWIIAAVFFSAAVYTYHATRVIAPVLFFTLVSWKTLDALLTRKREWPRGLIILFLAFGGFVVSITPILLAARTPAVQQRIAETSIFSDTSYVETSNHLRAAASRTDGPVTRLLTHRYLLITSAVAKNFTSHLTPNFLFISGDSNLRHGTGFFGILYPFDAVFLLIGVVSVITALLQTNVGRPSRFLAGFFIIWLVIGILPASLSTATPHALRILPSSPVFLVILSLGYLFAFEWLKKQQMRIFIVGMFILCCANSVQLFRLWHVTTRIYPALSGGEWWQYGYEEMIQAVNQQRDGKTPIFITREQGRPAMYYWFYSKTSPQLVQAAETTSPMDQAEYLKFEEILFINSVNEAGRGIVASSLGGVLQLEKQYPNQVERLHTVTDLRGQVVWVVSRLR